MAQNKTQNEVVENFDAPKADANEMMNFMKLYNQNSIKLAGTVTQLEVSNPTPKIDKKTNAPILDDSGNPTFWEPFFTASISFEGGMTRINLTQKLFEGLQTNERYLFVGCMGQAFGKTAPVFHDIQSLT